jgi:hypothetical protein
MWLSQLYIIVNAVHRCVAGSVQAGDNNAFTERFYALFILHAAEQKS